jgi:phage terminase small subunit
MTPKQSRFVEEYLIDLNATKAAIRAGFSPKNADKIGSQLLGKTRVREAIAKAMGARSKRTQHSADAVIKELSLMAYANMMDYMTITKDGEAFVDLSKLTRDQAAAIQEITIDEAAGGAGDGRREKVQRTRFKLADKRGALELLGKHEKLFTDKLETVSEIQMKLKDMSDTELEQAIQLKMTELGFEVTKK